jgi:hypothetical protein
MTKSDKLLIEALQVLNPTQLDQLIEIAEKLGISIGEAVVVAIREHLALMSREERAEAVQQFMDETEIDLEEIY